MKQETYQKFDDLLKNNPVAGFYNELESIVGTSVPRFKGHEKAIEGLYRGLEDLGDRIHAVRSTEINGEDIFAYRSETGNQYDAVCVALMLYEDTEKAFNAFRTNFKEINPGIKEDITDPSDYLFFVQSLLREIVHGKKLMQTGIENLEQKKQFIDQYIGITRELEDFSKNLATDVKIETMRMFSDGLSPNIVFPYLLGMIQREYSAFRENQEGYLKVRQDALIVDMNKTLGKPPKLELVPPNTTIH